MAYCKSIISLIVVAIAIPACAQESSGKLNSDDALKKRVTDFVQPLIDNQWTRGMIVGVLKDGKQHYFGFGTVGDEEDSTPDKNTIFEIGSITKVFTALVLADMVARDEVALDDSLQKYLPKEFKVPSQGDKPITLESLARHQSGMTSIPLNFWANGDNYYDNDLSGKRWGEYSKEKLQTFFETPFPKFDAACKYNYSNLGMGTLGYALELQTGTSLNDLIVNRICKPLKMDSTSFHMKTTGPGHDADGNLADYWSLNKSILGGAFALRSNCQDMLAFGAAHLDPESTPLFPAIKLAIKPGDKINDLERIGLGWRINKYGVITSNGATGGFRAAIFIHPPTGSVVVTIVNSQFGGVVGGRAALFDQLAAVLVNVVLGSPIPDFGLPTLVEPDTTKFKDYVGNWKNADGSIDPNFPIHVQDGKLLMTGPGNMELRLWPSGPETFFVRPYIGELKFNRDESGKVNSADIKFEGREAKMKRSEE